MGGPSEVVESRRARSRGGLEAVGLAALLSIGVIAFYVLSVGPAARLCRSAQGSWCAPGGSAQSALESFYAPVLWLHERTRLRGVLDWYVQDLWGAE